jgi:hypothetical protein
MALTVFGVCWMELQNIAKAVKISDATMDRAMRKLTKMGILKKLQYHSNKGGRHYVLVIQPQPYSPTLPIKQEVEPSFLPLSDGTDDGSSEGFKPSEKMPDNPDTARHSGFSENPHRELKKDVTLISSTTSNTSTITPNTYVNNTLDITKQFGQVVQKFRTHYIPEEFKYIANFLDPDTLRDAWASVVFAKNKMHLNVHLFDIIRDSWKVSIRAYKGGKVGNLVRFFYGNLCYQYGQFMSELIQDEDWTALEYYFKCSDPEKKAPKRGLRSLSSPSVTYR